MNKFWLPLSSIPQAGATKVIDDQNFWESCLQEFQINGRIIEPVVATIVILPQEDGVLFQGTLAGVISLPCNRCMEDTLVKINHKFDTYEALPEVPYGYYTEETPELPPIDEEVIRLAGHGKGIEINPSALAWEELSLDLPVKPLCKNDCKGLCPKCGNNWNNTECKCDITEGDPRLAALQGLVINKNK